jgi:hypothetical protein
MADVPLAIRKPSASATRRLGLAQFVVAGIALAVTPVRADDDCAPPPRAPGAAAPLVAPDAGRFAMVVSGGISLGAYQAGASYAFLRYLVDRRSSGSNPARLAIVTGASAGNVNALLAAITWLQSDASSDTALRNLFWETWVNVGLDKLAPELNDQGCYAKSFASPSARSTFPRTVKPGIPSPGDWEEGLPVYSGADGLLTRRAFIAIQQNAVQHMAPGGPFSYRCAEPVAMGVTVTSQGIERIPVGKIRVPTQRFVVPLEIEARCPSPGTGAGLTMNAIGDDQWRDRHRVLGEVLSLSSPVQPDTLLDVIRASSAFPVAFAPVTLPDQRLGPQKFIDGGLFDNVPVGLAIALGKDPSRDYLQPSKGLTYFYVHPGLRRSQPAEPAARTQPNGIGFLTRLLGNYIDEARAYELQGIARFEGHELGLPSPGVERPADLGPRRFVTTSRYFRLVGDYLGAFGAFLNINYRRYDYFIGVYDALYTIAQSANQDPLRSEADWRAFVSRFRALRDEIVPAGSPDDSETALLRDLLDRLLADELSWTAPSTLGRCLQPPTNGLDTHGNGSRVRANDPVWKIRDVLRRYDEDAQRLAHDGSASQIRAFEERSGSLAAFLDEVGDATAAERGACGSSWLAQRFEEDGRFGWEQATIDRLLRRAIDVEHADAAQGGGSAEGPLEVARLGAASGLERGREVVDLDPSSVARIGAGSPWQWPWRLLPYYLAKDSLSCAVEVGWEPKLRVTSRVFIGGGLGGRKRLCHDDGVGYQQRLAVGAGYDPEGRLWDDFQILLTAYDPLAIAVPRLRMVGAEVAINVGTKLRLAFGARDIVTRSPGERLAFAARDWGSSWFDHLYLSIGLTDLNAVLYWGVRSATRWRRENGGEQGLAP